MNYKLFVRLTFLGMGLCCNVIRASLMQLVVQRRKEAKRRADDLCAILGLGGIDHARLSKLEEHGARLDEDLDNIFDQVHKLRERMIRRDRGVVSLKHDGSNFYSLDVQTGSGQVLLSYLMSNFKSLKQNVVILQRELREVKSTNAYLQRRVSDLERHVEELRSNKEED